MPPHRQRGQAAGDTGPLCPEHNVIDCSQVQGALPERTSYSPGDAWEPQGVSQVEPRPSLAQMDRSAEHVTGQTMGFLQTLHHSILGEGGRPVAGKVGDERKTQNLYFGTRDHLCKRLCVCEPERTTNTLC